MSKSKILANRFREATLNGTWIANTNYKQQLDSISIEQANQKVADLNTICILAQHINYYIEGIINVFENGELNIKDKYSFDFEPITNQGEWGTFKTEFNKNAEQFANYVEDLTDEQLQNIFVKADYGTYERNIEAMIEHAYYHLGQISLINKLI